MNVANAQSGRTPVSNAIDYAKFRSRSHDDVIRVYNEAGDLIETHEHAGVAKSGSRGAKTASLGPTLLIEQSRLLPEPRAVATFMNRKKAG